MPAAASENTPRTFPGMGLANRRCSEWRAATGPVPLGPGRALGKPDFGQAELRFGTGRHGAGLGTDRRKEEVFGPDPPPDGTGRPRRYARRFFAGSHEPPDCERQHDWRKASQPEAIGSDATSITMRKHSRCEGMRGALPSASPRPGCSERPRERQSPNRPEPWQASVGLAEMPAPFAFWRPRSRRELRSCTSHRPD
jgi:hypothetical protein